MQLLLLEEIILLVTCYLLMIKHKQKKKEKDMIMLLKNITRPLSGFERGKKSYKILSPKMTGSNIRPLRIS